MMPHPQHATQQSSPLLSQQAQRLLEDCRNENRMLEEAVGTLKEQVNMFEQEAEQQREQIRIKEANYEEEIQILKGQVNSKKSIKNNSDIKKCIKKYFQVHPSHLV